MSDLKQRWKEYDNQLRGLDKQSHKTVHVPVTKKAMDNIFTGEIGKVESFRFVELAFRETFGQGKWRNKGRGPKKHICWHKKFYNLNILHRGQVGERCSKCGEEIMAKWVKVSGYQSPLVKLLKAIPTEAL